MVLSIAINQTQFRHDSTVMPRITIADYANIPFVKLHNWQYLKASYYTFILEPNNRSLADCPLYVRDCFHNLAGWTIDAPVGGFSIGGSLPYVFYRNGGAAGGSWKGAYYATALNGNLVTIQAKANSIDLAAGISLQDSPFTTHTYDVNVAHGLIFGANGKLAIFERGVQPKTLATAFRYKVGDVGMIEYDKVKNLVRYYLVRADKEMILLRTTRPKFTTNPIAEMMLFQPGSSLSDVLICNGAQAQTTFENIAVARQVTAVTSYQSWKNQRNRVSNADPIQLADGEFEFTFPSSKTTLRQMALTPRARNQAGFDALEDFFNWHGNEKEFLFIDEARKDTSGNAQEFWARFQGGMTDTTGNGCLYDYSVQVVEAYRGDYVPRQLDLQIPALFLYENDGPMGFAHFLLQTTDNVGCTYAQIFVDGVQIGGNVLTNGTETFDFTFSKDGFTPGTHVVTAKAYDFAGNVGTGGPRSLVI